MAFHAYEVAIELCRALRKPVALLRTRNRSLADQLQRAATSIPLNVAEGRARSGRDRTQHYRIALGSAAEVGAALDVALAWGPPRRGGYASPARARRPREGDPLGPDRPVARLGRSRRCWRERLATLRSGSGSRTGSGRGRGSTRPAT